MREFAGNLLKMTKVCLYVCNFWKKNFISHFAALIFWQFSEKIQNHAPRIQLSLSFSLFALRRLPEYAKTGYLKKNRIGLFWVGKLGGDEV